MPSTNKTTNLQLNQWQLSDGVAMEDFNADNRKLDAALGLIPLAKLKTVVTSAAAAQVDIDMTDIDMDDYMELIVIPKVSVPEAYVRVNDLAISSSYRTTEGGSSILTAFGHGSYGLPWEATLHLRVSSGYIGAFSEVYGKGDQRYSLGQVRSGFTWDPVAPLTKLSIVAQNGGSIPAGSSFVFYGLR